jgi:hypothetical protein
VSPFGSLISSYWSRGGRTAASTGDKVSATQNATALSSFFGMCEIIIAVSILT